jgi:hypothetical protein
LEHVIDDEESFNIEQRWYINSIQYSALWICFSIPFSPWEDTLLGFGKRHRRYTVDTTQITSNNGISSTLPHCTEAKHQEGEHPGFYLYKNVFNPTSDQQGTEISCLLASYTLSKQRCLTLLQHPAIHLAGFAPHPWLP